jgi:hypothetical protein
MKSINQIDAMRAFVAVVESGSFSAAARRLRIQQSSVSRTIGALESEYDTELLSRTTRRMRLTEAEGNLPHRLPTHPRRFGGRGRPYQTRPR